MKIYFSLLLSILLSSTLDAQELSHFVQPQEQHLATASSWAGPRLRQRNYGAIIGLQRGRNTAIELGAEMHWRKVALKDPRIWGATTNLEYSFGDNIIGYKAGVWRKQGRVNLTYGANLAYFTDFNGGHQFGIGPSVGFRILGLHLVNGYNILAGEMNPPKNGGTPPKANTLYISLRYYFPVDNTFIWDRKNKKGKRYGLLGLKKQKESKGLFGNKKKEEPKGLFRKRQPEPEPKKGLFGKRKVEEAPAKKGLFGKKKKQEQPEPEPERKKLRDLFKKD